MASSDLVQDFLAQLEPDDVPFEYISCASIRDLTGQEVVLKGEELKRLMTNHPDYSYVKDARIFINIKKIVTMINLEVEYMFEQVDMIFRKQSEEEDGTA